MNGIRDYMQERSGQKRLVALLFSLAALCVIAASMPAGVRHFMLFVLRRAERVAFEHIRYTAYESGLMVQWILPPGCRIYSDPEAAQQLGWWFRILAIMLRDLPRRAFFHKLRNARFPSPHCSRGEGRGEGHLLSAGEGVGTTGVCGSRSQRGPPDNLLHPRPPGRVP